MLSFIVVFGVTKAFSNYAAGLFPLFFAAAGMNLAQIGVLAAIYPASWGSSNDTLFKVGVEIGVAEMGKATRGGIARGC